MKITCTNPDFTNDEGIKEDCTNEFEFDTTKFEAVSTEKFKDSTQFLYEEDVSCSRCDQNISVRYTCDIHDETNEILSEDIEYN